MRGFRSLAADPLAKAGAERVKSPAVRLSVGPNIIRRANRRTPPFGKGTLPSGLGARERILYTHEDLFRVHRSGGSVLSDDSREDCRVAGGIGSRSAHSSFDPRGCLAGGPVRFTTRSIPAGSELASAVRSVCCGSFRILLWAGLRDRLRSGRYNQESVFILSAGRGKEDLASDYGYHTPELQAGTVFRSGGGRELDSVQLGLEAFFRSSGRSSPTG